MLPKLIDTLPQNLDASGGIRGRYRSFLIKGSEAFDFVCGREKHVESALIGAGDSVWDVEEIARQKVQVVSRSRAVASCSELLLCVVSAIQVMLNLRSGQAA